MRLSLAMIVRDEEDSIADILTDAAAFCDELIVVDTGSTDRTVEIASSLGASVYHYTWNDNFSMARNFSFDMAAGDWIFWADADDRVPCGQQWREDIEKADEAGASSVWGEYRYGGGVVVLRERALRWKDYPRWQGVVHEVIACDWDNRLVSTAYVEHHRTPTQAARDTGRNIRILENAYKGGDRSARTLLYLARECKDHGRHNDALRYFGHYFAVGASSPWEQLEAKAQQGECLLALSNQDDGYDEYRRTNAIDCAFECIKTAPTRAEGYLLAGRVHYEVGRWRAAIPFFQGATGATRPADGIFSEADYTYLPWDYLAQCYARIGEKETAARITVEHLLGKTPDEARIRGNLTYFTSPDWRP